MKKRLTIILTTFALLIFGSCTYVKQPTLSSNKRTTNKVNPEKLKQHVKMLSETCHPRSYEDIENQEKVCQYIEDHFRSTNGELSIQKYTVDKKEFKNISCIFGKGKGKRLIVGAHYDSCNKTPGADDNASAVAGLLELATLLNSTKNFDNEIELVAYNLEEPPFFGTDDMGSFYHAKSIAENKVDVSGVIILEMIGYFTDKRGSQQYPVPILKLFYPSKGNFIAVVGKLDQKKFVKQVKKGMKGVTDLPVYSLSAPESTPGVGLSDHRNYWQFNTNAVMITDTSFMRNPNYHTPEDTWQTLDYERMAQVVLSVHNCVNNFNIK